jgi:hypothetical protein
MPDHSESADAGMSDLRLIVNAAKRLEVILEQRYGASGQGLHEKLTSVALVIPEDLQGKIHYVATVRNRSIYETGYRPEDVATVLKMAQEAFERLQATGIRPSRCFQKTHRKGMRFMALALLVGMGAVWFWSARPGWQAAKSAAPADSQRAASAAANP